MITLSEAQQYTTNKVVKGVLGEIMKDSPILQNIPWAGVVGNALQYLREADLPGASFYDPNETWTEETGRVYQVTATIKIMGKDADIDNFLQSTRSDHTDIEAETIQMSSKGVKHAFLQQFWYGDSSTSSKQFDGVHRFFLTGGESAAELTNQSFHIGSAATGAAGAVSDLDEAYDAVRDGSPNMIVTTRNIRRRLTQYLRTLANVEMTKDGFGNLIPTWNGMPLYIDDFLTQTETISSSKFSARTGGATGSMFFLTLENDAIHGLQNGAMSVRKLGQLMHKDSVRWRIRWYVGLCLKRTIRCSIIDGITDVAFTAT